MAATPAPDFAFTEYVRALDPEVRPARDLFDAAWQKLRRILVSELERRSLAAAPPTFLGIYGHQSWFASEGPLDELTHDCFTHVFVERLTLLEDLAAKLEHVDAIVFGYVRFFLYDRQKKNDPLGFRVFEILRDATRRLIRKNVLHVLGGDRKIRSSTVLGFVRGVDPGHVRGVDLSASVATWGDDLLPELVTAPPKKLEGVEERLSRHLRGLEERARAFFFRDVAGPFKENIRKRWLTGARTGDGEHPGVLGLERPGAGFEERQRFERLVACVEEALPGLTRRKNTREHLRRLWTYVKVHVAECGEDPLPSDRWLEKRIAVPRKKIPKLLQLLKGAVEHCRSDRARSDRAVR